MPSAGGLALILGAVCVTLQIQGRLAFFRLAPWAGAEVYIFLPYPSKGDYTLRRQFFNELYQWHCYITALFATPPL